MRNVILVIFLTTLTLLLPQALALPKPSQSNFFKYKTSSLKSTSKHELYGQSVQFSMAKAGSARALVHNLTPSSPAGDGALNDCLELLDDTLALLSAAAAASGDGDGDGDRDDDVHTWLSAAMTNQETCLESLETRRFASKVKVGPNDVALESTARNLSQFISNSLSLFLSSSDTPNPTTNGGTRKLLSSRMSGSEEQFPTWTTAAERRLLESPVSAIKADAVVAQDGSGTHRTISEAIADLAVTRGGGPLGESKAEEGGGRTVIHVTAGTYHEYIKITTKQKNVMLVGDGKGKSVIVGNKNSEDGSTTYNSATVGAMGDGFIARDITFVNNAGPEKHQAVALRVGSDRSVVFKCSIEGYQDSLYTHSKRQFYRETDIYGTVDFIFGNSAVVFQSCNILARKPVSTDHNNFVTAQGRSSPDQNTGISIHNCRIGAGSDLAPVKSKYNTYLGRPWKQYSRTIIMESVIDDSINSRGFFPWSGGFALKTLFYGEYKNTGLGSSTGGRVDWAGYHSSLTAPQANSFTVAGFISGNAWLPSTGVSFDSGLVG